MKLALISVALVVIAMFGITTSCTISHKSGDYACATSADCNSGRECSNGFCVLTGTSIDAPKAVDAPKLTPDSGNGCPAGCTSCSTTEKTCVIDCNVPGANCDAQVVCPVGYKCDVKCDVANSCRAGVKCTGTTSCMVECSAQGSCQGVQCGSGRCDVQCSGTGSCKGVQCGSSCACNVGCTGNNSCPTTGQSMVTCTDFECRIFTGNGGCSSTLAPSCDTCP
ncbi:hypothetical protein BH11MYX1_BH11MYX1_17790 [soil metagenome]